MQAADADIQVVRHTDAAVAAALADAVQSRWAKLLLARYQAPLAAYAAGNSEAPPIGICGFEGLLKQAGRVEAAAAATKRPAAALRQALRGLGRDLLAVRLRGALVLEMLRESGIVRGCVQASSCGGRMQFGATIL